MHTSAREAVKIVSRAYRSMHRTPLAKKFKAANDVRVDHAEGGVPLCDFHNHHTIEALAEHATLIVRDGKILGVNEGRNRRFACTLTGNLAADVASFRSRRDAAARRFCNA